MNNQRSRYKVTSYRKIKRIFFSQCYLLTFNSNKMFSLSEEKGYSLSDKSESKKTSENEKTQHNLHYIKLLKFICRHFYRHTQRLYQRRHSCVSRVLYQVAHEISFLMLINFQQRPIFILYKNEKLCLYFWQCQLSSIWKKHIFAMFNLSSNFSTQKTFRQA